MSKTMRCLIFECSYVYYAGYYRKCSRCKTIQAGWGSKHLNPGDDFDRLYFLKEDQSVNPDNFREQK